MMDFYADRREVYRCDFWIVILAGWRIRLLQGWSKMNDMQMAVLRKAKGAHGEGSSVDREEDARVLNV